MSSDVNIQPGQAHDGAHPTVDHAHTAGHGHGDTHAHGTFTSYMIGFVLSVILTAIPFYLVMTGKLGNKDATAIAIMALAIVQIFVHMVYFLHMNTKAEGGWSILALMFTLIIVVIALSGSLWVMYHLNANMMPAMTGHDASQLP